MPDQLPYFTPHLELGDDPDAPEGDDLRRGRRPVIFDVVKADRETSILPEGLRLVLHVNPRTMSLSYGKQTDRVQTRGGFVEFHWGDAAEEITFEAATGGFMRLYAGLSNITGGSGTQGRRETIAYDKYLDLLALFHNNGAIYDRLGNIVQQGYIKMTFDGAVHIGWFSDQFTVTESANQPYMFDLSTKFIIDQEILRWRSADLGFRSDRIGATPLSTFDAESITFRDITEAERLRTSLTELIDPFSVPPPTNPELDDTPDLLKNPFATQPATTILDENVDPFATDPFDPQRALEEDPELVLEPGQVETFPEDPDVGVGILPDFEPEPGGPPEPEEPEEEEEEAEDSESLPGVLDPEPLPGVEEEP